MKSVMLCLLKHKVALREALLLLFHIQIFQGLGATFEIVCRVKDSKIGYENKMTLRSIS